MSLSEPVSVEDALNRLPTRQHHLYNRDKAIEPLAHYREWMEEILFTSPDKTFEERVMELTLEELTLMEQTSFARSKRGHIVIGWATVVNESPWAEILNRSAKDDDCNGFWRLSLAQVQPKSESQRMIVFIEKCDDYDLGEPNFGAQTVVNLAIASRKELSDLFGILCENRLPLVGDVTGFLYGAVQLPLAVA